MKCTWKHLAIGVVCIALATGVAKAADRATKDEAVAMVNKAVEYIKANGVRCVEGYLTLVLCREHQ